ncbi:2-amino-4-hydroxy-6-hydroxymethyldihydropteridine pyrophosphokinase [Rhodomicrobium vannielii ATCC 17100]|uniref:2-amino-4-hydroxy-6-hydroxymethyldihydropteridine pyrophosphokinase n=1 Tax=Rhodomicrobium vannielii (strain ATCC 17100 / DSM 162 / LMG 4299 / NCIMB 10020 / ATH 3.1.1) TaxID=648757 RepID=E3I369_RHOVT|nr:2-amino-4-hydroxy-6-hydroxymethyldihydropteridine pyrophosphokinase [Rhodomicrobium vannielii ATCC 17100]
MARYMSANQGILLQNGIFIALGSNLPGPWGSPEETLQRAVRELASCGVEIEKTSRLYRTKAHSEVEQPDFVNAVASVNSSMPADALLRVLKRIEAQAGRFLTVKHHHADHRWAPRPLDLDIVSYKSLVRNWLRGHPVRDAKLTLPHPRAHERAFVLRPLMDVAPRWHHPVLGLTAAALLARPTVRDTGAILDVDGLLVEMNSRRYSKDITSPRTEA